MPGRDVTYRINDSRSFYASRGRGPTIASRLGCFAEGLSKAQGARFVGAKDGLSTERTCIVHTLLRGMIDGIVRWDVEGLARAEAIAAGLVIIVAGYTTNTIERLVVCEAGNESVSENIKSSLPLEGLPIQ